MEIKKTRPASPVNKKGFSLIEMLVVLAVFSILTVVMTQVLFVTVRGAKKSDATVRVRQNIETSLSAIERQLHNAADVPLCPNPDPSTLTLEDINGNNTTFSCVNIGNGGYIASNSARLTSPDIIITACDINCIGGGGTPKSVTFDVTAVDANAKGSENASISTSNRVFLRSY